MSETTSAYNPTTVDDLTDTALVAIEDAKAIRDLVQVSRIAAAALDTRGMRVTARQLRALCDRVQRARNIH